MAILAECPICHRKQSTKNKVCKCGESLDKAKRGKRVNYWISYRLPGGKQRREVVGKSIEKARDAIGKRRGQKREGRIFDMLPESKMTFSELAEWYLNLKSVKKLASYERVKGCIVNFNEVFGTWVVGTIKSENLEDYQDKREAEGKAMATIDMELSVVQTMVTKAFDNDRVDGRVLKAFRKVKKLLEKGANARDREMTIEEYLQLIEGKYVARWKIRGIAKREVKDVSPPHLRSLLIVAYHTGMRKGELLGLRRSHIDREKGFIRLPAEMTKERKPKSIPINHHVERVLAALPRRALHHDFVFTYKGEPIGKLRRSFENACKNAGIPYGQKVKGGIRFHDIRTTFKTNMARAGVDKVWRDTILGHSLKGMDAYYIKPTDRDLQAAMDRFTTWYDDQVGNVDQTLTKHQAAGNQSKLSA